LPAARSTVGDARWCRGAKVATRTGRKYRELTMDRVLRGAPRGEPSFEEVFSLSLDLLCIGGLDGYFKRVNPAFEVAFGYSSDELLSRPFLEFVHPGDRARSQKALERLLRGEEVVGLENRNLRADGSTLWLEWSARPVPREPLFYGAGHDVTDRKRSEDQLSALRRVAALVASEPSPDEVFGSVAEEVVRLVGVDNTLVFRYEAEGPATLVAAGGEGDIGVPVGTRVTLEGENVAARVLRTRRPARLDDYANATGAIAALARNVGIRSAVGSPIVVEGRLWGAMVALSRQVEPLPVEAESRIGEFTALVATAISNAEARAEVRLLAEEQAALRRVATLVARGASPKDVFDAVATEAAAVLDVERVVLLRYEPDSHVTALAHRTQDGNAIPTGTRVPVEGENVPAAVLRTGRPARIDDMERATGPVAELSKERGVRSTAGVPVVVDGALWGVLGIGSMREEPPPADLEERMAQFAELVETAIANADGREQLTASRARVLAAGDEARRRVVRDLHDGAQQRLVHTIVTLKLAQQALVEGRETSNSFLAEALAQAEQANTELRELARGILPSVLSRGGLRPGIEALVSRISLPVIVDVSGERFPAGIEASAYFVVAEALTNVVKHSRATGAEVTASAQNGVLHVEVIDDGVGGALPDGTGLVGLDDRVAAAGGRLRVESRSGGGTSVAADLPLPV
jgi:PAS domain S-box-containing protein